MARLFHLSDLHFGPSFNAHLSELLLQDIVQAKPDLTILSGDFTMRGRVDEYEQARAYIQKIPAPVLTIPGNHDQPLSLETVPERLTRTWGRYTRYINASVNVSVEVPGVMVVGVNDNHPIVPGGIWSSAQRAWLTAEFKRATRGACKILAMHHQLNWNGRWRPFGQWFPTAHLRWLASLGVELVLNGHTHVPLTVQTAQGIVIAQAGTSMSGRVRHGHGNAYNQIRIEPTVLIVTVMGYVSAADKFIPRDTKTFSRSRSMEEQGA